MFYNFFIKFRPTETEGAGGGGGGGGGAYPPAPPPPPPEILANFYFLWTEKKNSVKVKNSEKLQNLLKLFKIYWFL